MSHSTNIQGFTFRHNGDYSGGVEVEHEDWDCCFEVPFSALVAGYVVGEKIAALEKADTLAVLLGRVPCSPIVPKAR